MIISNKKKDYLSLTDIARFKNKKRSDYVIQNWMRNYYTINFLGIWESLYNKKFNSIEFDGIKDDAGNNSFVLTPKKWIEKTNAIGIISQTGRYGGTYAHKDIAFEFASWISPEFKLYLIKEFQRLKIEEQKNTSVEWDVKRNIAKMNYRILTNAIKQNLIPKKITKKQEKIIYANEADVLNVALFGMTAKEWRDKNSDKKGNVRDYANLTQLIVLSNLECLNSEFIKENISQSDRLVKLNEIAISQMKVLLENRKTMEKIENYGNKRKN